jgi:mono/diheme cytochrome c family protein
MSPGNRTWIVGSLLATSIAAASAVGVLTLWPRLRGGDNVAAAATIALGRDIYAKSCAACHGANLEGQPDWKRLLPSGRLPAPPHDASGHTWHHPDGVLLRITKEGPAAIVGGSYESDMPGFKDKLSDDEIRAVLAYIKSTWPERERRYQQEMSRREREAQ